MPYNESDDHDVYEIIDQAYSKADRMSRPIHLLLETYQKYEEHDPNADRVADDRQALEWLDDYWEYVKWNEHGNESSIDEVGGFRGLARTVTDSDYVDSTLNYLIYEDDPNLIDPTARDLADRLKIIANRYGALRKMKKMSFTERVCQYIKNNYDIPDKMEFYIGTDGYDFEDWVDAYVEEYNNNVSSPYGNDSDESDVKVVAEEILQIMTAPYKMGNEYVINNDDFEASTKKSKSVKKAQIAIDLDWNEYGEPLDTVLVDVPNSITYNGKSIPASGDAEDGKITYTIKDSPNYDERVFVSVSAIDGTPWGDGESITISAVAPTGDKFSEYSAKFAYYKEIKRKEANAQNIAQAVNEAVASLPNDVYSASTKKMRKSRISKNIDDCWDAVSSSEDARFIQEVIDNGKLIEEYDADEDGSKVHVKIYSYDFERYRVVYVDDYLPFMQYDETNVFWKDRKHVSAKKMKKSESSQKYASTKKSQDINSMIASIRKNNNSLVKNRVDLK